MNLWKYKSYVKSLLCTKHSTNMKPFSNLYFQLLSLNFRLGKFFGITVLTWDAGNQATKVSGSRFLHWKSRSTLTIYFLHAVFLAIQSLRCKSSCTMEEVSNVVVFFSYISFTSLAMMLNILQAQESSDLLNMLLSYLRGYYGKHSCAYEYFYITEYRISLLKFLTEH